MTQFEPPAPPEIPLPSTRLRQQELAQPPADLNCTLDGQQTVSEDSPDDLGHEKLGQFASPSSPSEPRGADRVRRAFRSFDVEACGVVCREFVEKAFHHMGGQPPSSKVLDPFTDTKAGTFRYEEFLEWLYGPDNLTAGIDATSTEDPSSLALPPAMESVPATSLHMHCSTPSVTTAVLGAVPAIAAAAAAAAAALATAPEPCLQRPHRLPPLPGSLASAAALDKHISRLLAAVPPEEARCDQSVSTEEFGVAEARDDRVPTPQVAFCGRAAPGLEFAAQTPESEAVCIDAPPDDAPGPMQPPQPNFLGHCSMPMPLPDVEVLTAMHRVSAVEALNHKASNDEEARVIEAPADDLLPPQPAFAKWTVAAHSVETRGHASGPLLQAESVMPPLPVESPEPPSFDHARPWTPPEQSSYVVDVSEDDVPATTLFRPTVLPHALIKSELPVVAQGQSSNNAWMSEPTPPVEGPPKDQVPPPRVPVPPLLHLPSDACDGGDSGGVSSAAANGNYDTHANPPAPSSEGEDSEAVEVLVDTSRESLRSGLFAALVILCWVVLLIALGVAARDFDEPQCPEKRTAGCCQPCGAGLVFLPALGEFERSWPDALRVVLYFMGMCWMFQGIGVICDKFMEAIEEITSCTRLVWVESRHGARRKRHVKIWNDTIANLTLMALGSSAPEILLNVIEIYNGNFFAGELGASTIVGSAAFNLLMITAVCVSALPPGETRRIVHINVFAVTATFSVFAYLWLVIILQASSPNKVDTWEAMVTFLMFPALLILAYLADRGWLGRPFCRLLGNQVEVLDPQQCLRRIEDEPAKSMPRKTQHLTNNPEGIACFKVAPEQTSGTRANGWHENKVSVGFEVEVHEVPEWEGCISLKVVASGALSSTVQVRYCTRDGSAREGRRYRRAEGHLTFTPRELEKVIKVPIIREQGGRSDERFFVELNDLRAADGTVGSRQLCLGLDKATVTIVSQEAKGLLAFEANQVYPSQPGRLVMDVVRTNSRRGRIYCRYATECLDAVANRDFIPVQGPLVFEDGVEHQTIEVHTVNNPARPSESACRFRVRLLEPSSGAKLDVSSNLGCSTCEVVLAAGLAPSVGSRLRGAILGDDPVHETLEMWREQVTSAFYCNGSAEQQAEATWQDWLFHFFALPWNVLFAFVPPSPLCGGWLCFFVALGAIGIVTALVGDIASLLGCTTGFIPDDITAITLVALGTSLPDTFASKLAAQQDETADNSVGNVTGSNSVNVFLGVGLPYTWAALYWDNEGITPEWRERTWKGQTFQKLFESEYPEGGFIVPAESLGFSVLVFTACALVAIALLVLRRKAYGGELGGPKHSQMRDSAILASLWVVFIVVSVVKSMSTQ
mmetsp:Transcript_137900/g.344236  ORF Transcript_137900/g.344236 Transcript_137900/m.344236 type:complete len:1359 (+) Transcript_137900:128-4204(+)